MFPRWEYWYQYEYPTIITILNISNTNTTNQFKEKVNIGNLGKELPTFYLSNINAVDSGLVSDDHQVRRWEICDKVCTTWSQIFLCFIQVLALTLAAFQVLWNDLWYIPQCYFSISSCSTKVGRNFVCDTNENMLYRQDTMIVEVCLSYHLKRSLIFLKSQEPAVENEKETQSLVTAMKRN